MRLGFAERGAPGDAPRRRWGGSLTTSFLGKACRAAGARAFGLISCERAVSAQLMLKTKPTTVTTRMSHHQIRRTTCAPIAQSRKINHSRLGVCI